jgi:hypothetical protein
LNSLVSENININDVLGDFALTMVDTLDTIAVSVYHVYSKREAFY